MQEVAFARVATHAAESDGHHGSKHGEPAVYDRKPKNPAAEAVLQV
jgi:hypothetical protein